MFEKQKQIDDYRLQHLEQSVIIDEKDGPISTIFRIALGLAFILFAGVLFFQIVFFAGIPNFGQYTSANWLAFSILFCAVFFVSSMGFLVAFARSHVEATSEKILTGNTWFGVPVKLKITPVSEISAIKLAWERGASPFGGRRYCAVSALSVKKAKSILLFSSSKKEAALELANAVAAITKLPVQDIPQS